MLPNVQENVDQFKGERLLPMAEMKDILQWVLIPGIQLRLLNEKVLCTQAITSKLLHLFWGLLKLLLS